MSKPSIAWLFTDWSMNTYREVNDLYGGIAYYRVIKPAQVLRKWFDIEVIGQDFKHWGTTDETYNRLGKDYDLIISKHIMDSQTASNILATAQHFNRKVVVDVDDNYSSIRKENPAFKVYDKGEEGRYSFLTMLELSNGMTVSTDPLKEVYSKHNKNIDVLPNCNDIHDWPTPTKRNDGKIRIGYAGGAGHMDDLELIIEPIAKILTKYPNVVFEVIGALGREDAMRMGAKMIQVAHKNILERFIVSAATEAWLGYPEFLCSQGWDIAIAPLVNDDFNKGKSHIKWLESSMIGAATIASPVYPYIEPIQGLDTIVHGKTGLFANSSEEWFENLDLLVRNESVRKELATNAYDYIAKNWQYSQHAGKWKTVIEKYLN